MILRLTKERLWLFEYRGTSRFRELRPVIRKSSHPAFYSVLYHWKVFEDFMFWVKTDLVKKLFQPFFRRDSLALDKIWNFGERSHHSNFQTRILSTISHFQFFHEKLLRTYDRSSEKEMFGVCWKVVKTDRLWVNFSFSFLLTRIKFIKSRLLEAIIFILSFFILDQFQKLPIFFFDVFLSTNLQPAVRFLLEYAITKMHFEFHHARCRCSRHFVCEIISEIEFIYLHFFKSSSSKINHFQTRSSFSCKNYHFLLS